MASFIDYRKALAPPFLRGEWGDAFQEIAGDEEDQLLARAKEAVKARFPALAPVDALPQLGADRLILRGPGEANESYVARLVAWRGAWKWAGTEKGLLQHGLAPAGLANTAVISNRKWATLGGVSPDGRTDLWARFHVVLGTPHGVTLNGLWGASGRKWGAKTTPWGSDASVDTIARIRLLVETWRPAHAKCVGVFIINGSSTAIDTVPGTAWREPDATFGGQRCIFWRFP